MQILKRLQARAFFQGQIPQKSKIKCCRYEQNGQKMPFFQAQSIHSTLGNLIQGWRLNQDGSRLFRHFYLEDYQNAIAFIGEMARLDHNTTRNCPSFSVQRGEILTVELYSPSLNGLSQVDFELAMNLNQIDYRKFYLIDIKDIDNYKDEITAFRMKRQSEQIQKDLEQTIK